MPWPLRSRNFAIVDSGVSGASSWMQEPGVADPDHRLADALLLVDLLVEDLHAVGVAVERHRLVEVGHRDADVVDGGEEVLDVVGEVGRRRSWATSCTPAGERREGV